MSRTYNLVCNETKKRIWIGQSGKKPFYLYQKPEGHIAALEKFLMDHHGKPIFFLEEGKLDDVHIDYEECGFEN